ncbi:L-aspartate-alpha-decarboxylase [Rubidibacter lacunae KORDI 51-2]|uniref:Aspartate 1-decarboxylase n=1 Tax=Rubidibacter lacunae KORDI 51-2 TaxID=582515 RepID=U5D568_9CHRO|nr:aspartate 1-decarboxylase [Rubidibacter lacunae]ERN39828.1 L-aspartate-alpha-decarboxylase [Rubidibacter lacunae KORDI 51-2]
MVFRSFLLGKIHNCTLTGTHLEYEGSISIDRTLLNAAGIAPYERVQVLNIATGARLETYAIAAPAGSGRVELNGAAARLGATGDRAIVMSYGWLSAEEADNHSARVVLVDERNVPVSQLQATVDCT